MVSLIDSKQQYILAEATKTLSLVTDTALSQKDQIWLGNAVLERSVAVCGLTFGSQYTATNEDGHTLTAEALVVPDMRLDARFKDRAYVRAKPGVQFYAGVPIRTKAGHNIGVYAVSSDEPRFGLSVDELQFMMDVAATVMQHLEMSKAVDDRYKGERMVRGLAKFIEGWDVPDSITSPGGTTPFSDGYPNSDYIANTPTLARQTENAHIEDDEVETLQRASHRPTTLSRNHTSEHSSAEKDESEDISKIYSRASRIIRESIAADGVVLFRTMTGVQIQEQGPNLHSASDISDTSDSGFSSANQRPVRARSTRLSRDINQRSSHPSEVSGTSTPEGQKLCEVLGWAVHNRDSRMALKKEDLVFPESSMERYIKRYPHGKYFNFSESGSGVSSDEKSESDTPTIVATQMHDAQHKPKKKSKSKRPGLSPAEILKFLPGLRNLIFLPLWDVASDKWSAGVFIWSFNSSRLMSPTHELPFLKAFGNSIMSEVARLNAQKADRAKSTFIASVSHELRSPLHGILGSVEFLQDTKMSSYQQGLVNSVEACGKTLLDTIDHVLDYAKINSLRGAGSRRKQQMATILSNSVLGADAKFDLSELVEEVVETVAAGHSFRKSRSTESFEGNKIVVEGKHQNSSTTTKSQLQHDAVDILLDISPHTGWTVCTQPGAIRRVVMNLLGNALKYTLAGFVSVLLKASSSQQNDGYLDLTLRFVDSGKGMSLEYQRTRLFAPFSQEDPFAAGTGLGLSIVRQIVESLKGSIIIKSTKDVGTEVEVSLSLPAVPEKRNNATKIIIPVADEIEDLKIDILSFSRKGGSSARVATSIHQTCESWFGAQMTAISNLNSASKDVLIIVEESDEVNFLIYSYIASERVAPLIIVTHDKAREIALKAKIQQVDSSAHLLIMPIAQP
jgi:signal transduction histidine kinase